MSDAAPGPPPLPDASSFEQRRNDVYERLSESLAVPSPWEPTFSPPLPRSWPLAAGVELVVHAAATRVTAPTLFEHTGLLAEASFDPLCQGAPCVLRHEVRVERVATAAVIPLTAAELGSVQSLPAVDVCFARIALGTTDPATAAALRAHFRFQARRAAWLHALLRPLHPGFYAWLELEA